jgi:hydrogenase maturation protease
MSTAPDGRGPTASGPPLAALVVGLGSTDRGDDAVGAVVARRVATLGLPGVQVLEHEDPTALIDLWSGLRQVVVVDAVCSGRPAGTLHRLDTSAGGAPLPGSTWADAGRGGTHAFGLAAVMELARALHRLPGSLVVIGIEASGFGYGAPLSAPVDGAVEAAVAEVLSALDGVPAGDGEGGGTGVPG